MFRPCCVKTKQYKDTIFSAGSSKTLGKLPTIPVAKLQAALKGSNTNTLIVTPPNDKGYKFKLEKTKVLYKELHKVQQASNKNTKLFTSTIYNLEYIITRLKYKREASKQ